MLHSELDVEVIRSAMLAGEVDDAVKWIEKSMEHITVYERVTKSSKYKPRYAFLEALKDYLSGNLTRTELRQNIEKIDGIRTYIVGPDEFEEFLDGFLYDIELAADRYNVRYPNFNGKRCDDK